jgi:hypothetical protein
MSEKYINVDFKLSFGTREEHYLTKTDQLILATYATNRNRFLCYVPSNSLQIRRNLH